MKVSIGTSGYNYPEWRGSFYPPKFPAAKMLPYYAERFSTVEINNTFYRMPTAKAVSGWAAATPATFTFVLKAPKRITHDARLKDVEAPLRAFSEAARLLGPKLGPLLFQLPPYFRKDAARLGDVLALIPAGIRTAFEFRHPSWFSDEIYELLRGRNSALCVADTEKGTTPLEATGTFGYFRLRDEGYSEADLERWSETIRALENRWTEVFVFFKHEESGIGPALAGRFRELLRPSSSAG
jgi:uncharacterized protein YecE (DUF72 family)